MIEFLDQIQEHFEKNYPREGCGILGVIKGKLNWFPCRNVAEDKDDFVIDSMQYLDISRKCDITAIIHSHPDTGPEPSSTDIKYCNALGIVYYIFSYPQMEMYILNPERISNPLAGREYEFGSQDCLSAGLDYYKSIGIVLPKRAPFEDNWWEKGLDYFTEDYIATWGFKKVTDNILKNDLLIFNIRCPIANHCGVSLGEDIFYHHAVGRLSCRENLYPLWKKHLTGVYRYVT
jgi:proteasome lid subunit RPN8/RPN11|tara:strand:+ start:410 stop:1108 length:699 start_codon:yes stop_codon:yes gene_type:complete